MLSPTICGFRPDAFHSLSAGRTISFGLRHALAGSPKPPTASSSLRPPIQAHFVTDWWFTFSCSPPGVIAPMQLLSVTGPTVSARSGTFTLLFRCALRRTRVRHPAARPQFPHIIPPFHHSTIPPFQHPASFHHSTFPSFHL